MTLRRLFQVLVVGGGALVATGCGGDSAVRPSPGVGEQQVLPDGGVVPMPGGGGTMGGGGTTTGGGGGGGGTGGPPGW